MPAAGAGELRERLRFEKHGPDANGDLIGPWDADGGVTRSARVFFRIGTEPVIEQRLQGLQPAEITVRADPDTRAIDNSWRAVDTRVEGRVFNITAAAPSEDRRWIIFMATVGGSDA